MKFWLWPKIKYLDFLIRNQHTWKHFKDDLVSGENVHGDSSNTKEVSSKWARVTSEKEGFTEKKMEFLFSSYEVHLIWVGILFQLMPEDQVTDYIENKFEQNKIIFCCKTFSLELIVNGLFKLFD